MTLLRIHEKIQQEAEIITEQRAFDFQYIKLATEIKKKIKSEFRDYPKSLNEASGQH